MTRSHGALFLFCLGITMPTYAQLGPQDSASLDDPVPYNPPAIHEATQRLNVRISPDGRMLALVAYGADGPELQIAPRDNPAAVRVLELPETTDYADYRWAFTSQHLLFFAGDPNRYLYSYQIMDGSIEPLSPSDGKTPRLVAVSERVPEEVVVANIGPQTTSLNRVNVTTGSPELLHTSRRYEGFLVDEEYRLRVAYTRKQDGGREYVAVTGTDETRWLPLLQVDGTQHPSTRPIAFEAGGGRLYLVDARESSRAELKLLDLTDGSAEMAATSPTMAVDGVLLHPQDHTLQAVRFTGSRTDWDFVDDQVAVDMKYLASVAGGEATVVSRSLDDEHWVVVFQDAGHREYFIFDRLSQSADYLFAARAATDPLSMSR